MRSSARRLAAVALSGALLAGGCSREESGTPSAAVPSAGAAQPATPQPVTLPDFSNLAPAVREQMQTAAAEFEARTGNPDAAASERADAYGEFGQLLLAAGFRETAATCFQNAEALAPGELRWPYYLGHIYRREGRIVEATAAFERAVRADGSFMPARVWLGNAYLDQGRPEDAVAQFERALSIAPDTVAAIFGLGRAASARNDYQTAVRHFERALELDPGAAAVHHPLGLAYRALGRPEEARSHLARQEPASELRPPDPLDVLPVEVQTAVSYDVRGNRALEAGDFAAARQLYGKAVELAPDDPAVRQKYATALALSGDQAAARRELELVTRRWPGFEKAQYSLGLIRADEGDIKGALQAFRRALDSAPHFLEPRLQLAHILRRLGEAGAALPEYEQILARDPRVVEARFGRAMSLVMLGRYADAREQLEEGRRLHPEETGFPLALARLLAAAPDDAVRDGKRAVTLADGIPESGRRIEWAIVRALALAEAGRFDEAVVTQRAVMNALERNGSPDLARSQGERLRLYESRRPARTPWRPDEPMELPDSGIILKPRT